MTKTAVTALIALCLGAAAAIVVMRNPSARIAEPIVRADPPNINAEIKYPLKATLQRFEVIEGKEQRFTEWMNFLRAERRAAIETLEGEKMYFEAVFSDKADGKTYAFWLTFKGEGGRPVESSQHELDKRHLEFWNECIKKDTRKVLETEFHLSPEFVDRAIAQHQMKEEQ